jgi:hypothetical protein
VGKDLRVLSKMGRGGAAAERRVSAHANFAGMASEDVGAAGEPGGFRGWGIGSDVRGRDGGICLEAGGVVP